MNIIIFILISIVLGIVEGLTEFLPVSSTGHLIIVERLFGLDAASPYMITYTYVIQLGAILAIFVLYRIKILNTLKTLIPEKDKDFKSSGLYFWLMIALASVPGAIAEFTIGKHIEKHFFNHYSVAGALIVGGIMMILFENKYRKTAKQTTLTVTAKQAIIIGLFQCLAIFPGMSRSASTIMGAWVAGLATVSAAEFSFFMAIPVMVGMSALKLITKASFASMTGTEVIGIIVGFVVSFIVAVIVVKKFIAFLKKYPMRLFAVYRFGFAIVVILFGIIGFF